MAPSLRRQRRYVASLVLATWLFGLFVGIAHACGWDGVTAMQHEPATVRVADGPSPTGVPPGCEKFCNDDLPLLTKIQSVQDSPVGQPLFATPQHALAVASISGPALDQAPTAHPRSDVPVSIRFLRLTL